MDKSQAEAIVQAMLEPGLSAQEELRRKQAAEDVQHARQRRGAWLVLAGGGAGAVIAHFSGVRFTQGILWGSVAGAFTAWLIQLRRPE